MGVFCCWSIYISSRGVDKPMLHNCWKYGALGLASCSRITNSHALFGQQDSLDRGKCRVFSASFTQLPAQAQHNFATQVGVAQVEVATDRLSSQVSTSRTVMDEETYLENGVHARTTRRRHKNICFTKLHKTC